MDEFRIIPTPPDNPYRDPAQSGAKHRKKSSHPSGQDDVVSLSGQDGDADDAPEDYYSPSDKTKEQE